MRPLQTVDRVLEVLGGPVEVAALTETSLNAVYNWRMRQKFPADTYLVMTQALRKKKHSARPELWGIRHPNRPRHTTREVAVI